MTRASVLLVAVLLAACGAQPPVSSPPATDEPRTSDAAPREPGTIEDLIAYGQEQVDEFGGLYIDPPGSDSVIMLFTANVDSHQQAVNEIVPGTRVRQVTHTEAELQELLESIDFAELQAQGIEMIGGSVDIIGNQVDLELKTNDPTVELSLELRHGGMLDVTVFPLPGAWSNATEGEGWQLVASGQASGNEAYIVRAATDDASWNELWETVALAGDQPAVDLAEQVVVSFAHGIGSSCPEMRLDGVGIEDGVVYSVTSDPMSPRACTADLVGAVTFVVALDRDALPAGGFTLRLCADCGFAEELDVELP